MRRPLSSRRSLLLILAAAVTAATPLVAHAAAPAADPAAEATLNQYGVSQALAGQLAAADSAFLALMSMHRHDARALNNLGNLKLMKGEYGPALAFYDAALAADSSDAGLHLNRAAALYVLGEDDRALEAAARANALAGNADRAGALLGLRSAEPDSGRAAERKALSPGTMRALLRKAAARVPVDTVHTAPARNPERGQGKRVQAWRGAVTRAADADSRLSLYWKR